MDRAMLEQHLAQAERHVTEGENHITRQLQLIAELAEGGHDLRSAQELLTQFESMQKLHVADRDRLRTELANM
jgi:TorA maturation chaperone TorD